MRSTFGISSNIILFDIPENHPRTTVDMTKTIETYSPIMLKIKIKFPLQIVARLKAKKKKKIPSDVSDEKHELHQSLNGLLKNAIAQSLQ